MNIQTISLDKLNPAEYNYSCYNNYMPNQYTDKSKYRINANAIELAGYKQLPFSDEYYVNTTGDVTSIYKYPNKLSQATDLKGYKKVMIRKDDKQFFALVHRLVAITFIGEPKGKEVDHIDGDKANNRLENLEWVTAKENENRKRHRLNNFGYGEQNPMAKLTKKDVAKIRKLWQSGRHTQQQIANMFNISQSHTHCICRGKLWN